MGRIAARSLSARKIATESRAGYYADGPNTGLYLQVTAGVAGPTRSWIYRYTSPTLGKRREIGLGPAAVRKLADARAVAAEYRRMVLEGRDPKDERDRAKVASATARAKQITFDQAVTDCIAAKSPEWRNAKHGQQWLNTLMTYASPVLGKLPVDTVTTALVFEVLKPIWQTKTETATRVRQRIEVVLDWCKARGYRTGDNPARLKGALGDLLPKAQKLRTVEHHPAVPHVQIHDFVTQLRRLAGIAPLGLELLLLTATRTNEVIAARWEEFDLAARVWTIPANRMKGGRKHRVPLSDRAIEILTTLQRAGSADWVLPGHSTKKASHLSNAAFLNVMGRLPAFKDFTPHGLRSTFRDWGSEMTTYPNEVLEAALAHTIKNKTEAAYRRSDLLQKRALLMAQWAAYVETPPTTATITAIGRAAR